MTSITDGLRILAPFNEDTNLGQVGNAALTGGAAGLLGGAVVTGITIPVARSAGHNWAKNLHYGKATLRGSVVTMIGLAELAAVGTFKFPKKGLEGLYGGLAIGAVAGFAGATAVGAAAVPGAFKNLRALTGAGLLTAAVGAATLGAVGYLGWRS